MGKQSNVFWLMSNLKGKHKRDTRLMVLCGVGMCLLGLCMKAFFHREMGEAAFWIAIGVFGVTMGMANGIIALIRQQEPPGA